MYLSKYELTQLLGRRGYYVFDRGTNGATENVLNIYIGPMINDTTEDIHTGKGQYVIELESFEVIEEGYKIVVKETLEKSFDTVEIWHPYILIEIDGLSLEQVLNKNISFEVVNKNGDKFESLKIFDVKGYKASISNKGKKEIYCSKNGDLTLLDRENGTQKVIFTGYDNSGDPYSITDVCKYNIQWSENDNYVYILNSVYDVKNDRLIPIEDCAAFSWINNKGVYLANGDLFNICVHASGYHEMFVGSEIKVIENGQIKTVKHSAGDKYFVIIPPVIKSNGSLFEIRDDKIIINTAMLKCDYEKLQGKMNQDCEALRILMNSISHYQSEDEKKQIQNRIEEIRSEYPLKIIRLDETHLSWDGYIEFYLMDIQEDFIVLR